MAAREAGVAYPRADYLGTDPLGFVVSRNLARRHLTESQRAMIAGELANMAAGRPKENAPDLGSFPPAEVTQPAAVSVQKAADMLNVGAPRSRPQRR